ncbi:C40 family peptidase [Paludibacterium purpuratum]|uniref:Cell wall-associated NlpC family hydrolase n=1 Tax=Paludibacterium purpuratum TaxID=1144873 RepID=A0A4R7BAI6_9NEIS|nr:C40 family peptidase [Paludibacterium purpuratum]TDR81960.1 cell wall-associated NlpC family hydrolase [Paludibacterium purpuratum]
MKLHRRILALALAGWLACVTAAPDKTAPDKVTKDDNTAAEPAGDPIGNYASSATDDAVGDMLLQAISLMGVAYRFGGSNPSTGLDCSGFIQYVFKKSLKVNLPRTAAGMAKVGRSINRAELMPGDLVFFNTRGFSYSHVGIYLGNGKFIHSPRTGKSIEVAQLNQSYWVAHYNGARRVARGSGGDSAASGTDVAAAADVPADSSSTLDTTPGKRVKSVCVKGKKCRTVGAKAAGAKKSGKKTRRH